MTPVEVVVVKDTVKQGNHAQWQAGSIESCTDRGFVVKTENETIFVINKE